MKNISLPTNNNELRLLIDQSNRFVKEYNDTVGSLDTRTGDLESLSFDLSKVLVNEDGDILTNEDGEVLLSDS